MEVEDLLRDALVRVLGRDQQGHHDRQPYEGGCREGQELEVIP